MTDPLPSADSPDTGCQNLRWSLALIDGLIDGGLRHLVLSPGSRSTPVVLAARRRAVLTLTAILDERAAAFFALGLARARAAPVAVLATSGSAPAHWYPAVIEASHWGLPLVLISADRPPLLRQALANQTIDQTRLFGAFVREFHDPGPARSDAQGLKAIRALGLRAALQSRSANPGPVHLNLPFGEPLVPAGDCAEPTAPEAASRIASPLSGALSGAQSGALKLPPGRGLLVCGPASARNAAEAAALRACAAHLGLPLLADPLSGVRFAGCSPRDSATTTCRHYDALLRHPAQAAALKPDWVLRLGLAPVSRTLEQWLENLPTWLVATGARWCDPGHDARARIDISPQQLSAACEAHPRRADPHWLTAWQAAEQRISALADAHLHAAPWCEGQMIRQLLAAIPPEEGLLCANSLPIRQLDTWSGPRTEPLHLFGNRGVSGIDGQLSTLAGLNAAGLPTWGLLGDLSFCHDLSGLLLAEHLQRPLIVINNGGGRIFDYLPQRELPDLVPYWRTPVAPNLAALAKAFALRHDQIQDGEALGAVLAQPPSARLIEVMIDAEQSRALHLAYWHQAANQAGR